VSPGIIAKHGGKGARTRRTFSDMKDRKVQSFRRDEISRPSRREVAGFTSPEYNEAAASVAPEAGRGGNHYG